MAVMSRSTVSPEGRSKESTTSSNRAVAIAAMVLGILVLLGIWLGA